MALSGLSEANIVIDKKTVDPIALKTIHEVENIYRLIFVRINEKWDICELKILPNMYIWDC